MELQNVLESRRSIRKYLNKSVKQEDVRKIIEAAILAPSWKNSQVTRYYVVQSENKLNQLKQYLP